MFDYIQLFKDRHLFNQCTNEEKLNSLLNEKKITFYIGFDATADALHAGSLVQLRAIKTLIKHGHKAIVLLGGGTTKIGDPSGKDETRKMLTEDEIKNNANNLKTVFDKYLSFKNEKNKALIVDNADWLDRLGYVDFLRDFGKHFTINNNLPGRDNKFALNEKKLKELCSWSKLIYEMNLNHGLDLQKVEKDIFKNYRGRWQSIKKRN